MLALIAFLTSIAYLPGTISAAYAPRWWVILILAPIALLLTRARPAKPTNGHWLGAAFLLVCVESIFWSVSPMDTINGVIQLVALAMIFCVAAQTEDFRPTWLALGAGAVVNVVFAKIHPAWVINADTAGLFYQQDFFGAFCAVALIGLLYGVHNKGWLGLFLVGACIMGLYMSHCRGAWLAAGVTIVAVKLVGMTAKVRLASGLALLIGSILACFMMYHFLPSRMGAVEARLMEWDWMSQNLHLFGWGFNTLGSVLPFEHADNDYVEMVFDLGILSAVFFAFIAYALKGARHALPCFAVLCVTLIDGLTSFPLRNPATSLVAAIALGGLCSYRSVVRCAGLQSPNFSGLYFVEPTQAWPEKNLCKSSGVPVGSSHQIYR